MRLALHLKLAAEMSFIAVADGQHKVLAPHEMLGTYGDEVIVVVSLQCDGFWSGVSRDPSLNVQWSRRASQTEAYPADLDALLAHAIAIRLPNGDPVQ